MESNGASVFKSVYGSRFGTTINRMQGNVSTLGAVGIADFRNIYLWDSGANDPNAVIHELGHVFDFKYLGYFHLDDIMLSGNHFPAALINSASGYSTEFGYGPFYSGDALFGIDRFADMFLGYVVGGFDLRVDHGPGQLRNAFMQGYMPFWLSRFYP